MGACLDEHDAFPVEGEPLRRLLKHERTRTGKVQITWYSLGCLHCQEPECAAACPKKCFYVDTQTGTVQLDSTACVGCGACARACRYGAIRLAGGHKSAKCDGCAGRLREGRLPRCVEACPAMALTVDERPAIVNECRRQIQKALATGGMKSPT